MKILIFLSLCVTLALVSFFEIIAMISWFSYVLKVFFPSTKSFVFSDFTNKKEKQYIFLSSCYENYVFVQIYQLILIVLLFLEVIDGIKSDD